MVGLRPLNPTDQGKNMEICICAVMDKKAEEFQAPFAQPNKATACRSFMQAVNEDQKSVLNQFSEDYALWQIGTFNVKTGEFKAQKEMLLEAANVVNKKK